MELILKAKHWQIFILNLIGIILSNFTIHGFPLETAVINIIGLFIILMYPFIIGYALQKYVLNKIILNINLFQFNLLVFFAVYSVIMIISDGKGMIFSGLISLPFYYVFYAMMNSFAFPAKTIRSIELNQEARFGDYIGDFFLIFFLPIGIWFIQPRINRIVRNDSFSSGDSAIENDKSF